MTDHIEYAKLLTEKVLPFVGYGTPAFAALKATIIMLERAALSAREGGEAVAWQRRSSADGYVSRWGDWNPDEWPTDPFPASSSRWVHEYRQLFLHPAQPASQQGEANGMRIELAAEEIRLAIFQSVDKCSDEECPDCRRLVRASRRLTAALDQEKGR